MNHKDHANLCADNLATQIRIMSTKKWANALDYAQVVKLREACAIFLAKTEAKAVKS